MELYDISSSILEDIEEESNRVFEWLYSLSKTQKVIEKNFIELVEEETKLEYKIFCDLICNTIIKNLPIGISLSLTEGKIFVTDKELQDTLEQGKSNDFQTKKEIFSACAKKIAEKIIYFHENEKLEEINLVLFISEITLEVGVEGLREYELQYLLKLINVELQEKNYILIKHKPLEIQAK